MKHLMSLAVAAALLSTPAVAQQAAHPPGHSGGHGQMAKQD